MSSVLVAVLAYFGQAGFSIVGTWFGFSASSKLAFQLRLILLEKMAALPPTYHESTSSGAKALMVRENVDQIGTLSGDAFPVIFKIVILGTCTLGAMCWLSIRLTLILMPMFVIFFFTLRHHRRVLFACSQDIQSFRTRSSGTVYEFLDHVPQFQLLNQARRQVLRVVGDLSKTLRLEHKRKSGEVRFNVAGALLSGSMFGLVMAIGGLEVLAGRLTVGGLVAFYAFLFYVLEQLSITVDLIARFQRIIPCIGSIREFLATPPVIMDAPNACEIVRSSKTPRIEFDRVWFAFRPNMPVVQNLSLQIDPGERLVLAGPSGAGKSTLVKLIPRMHDVTAGTVYLNGRDVRDVRLSSLRGTVAYLPQETVLFDCSLEENIVMGRSCTRRELNRIAEMIEIDAILTRLPSGWNERLSPKGNVLSGGQRQRLALARALVSYPGVLILDEATSQLDLPAEYVILDRLKTSAPDSTLIVVSHRIPAPNWADRILYVDAKQVIEVSYELVAEMTARGTPRMPS